MNKSNSFLLKNVRPMGRDATDVWVEDGMIKQMVSSGLNSGGNLPIFEGKNQLLLPGLVNAHAHVDKNLFGLGWYKNSLQKPTIQTLVDNERNLRHERQLSAGKQAALEIETAVSAGTTHIRTHIDVDTTAGVRHFAELLAVREAFKDQVAMQLVAFPQSGMLIRPGTAALLEEALKMGADCIGGLDPSTIDRDPVKHLDTIFELAQRYDVELDIHLHEPGMLGAFAVELIAERTRVLGFQGRVTISHAFCLGMVDPAYLSRLIDLLLENEIAIMSLGSGVSAFPPLKQLYEAGVKLCTGSDGVRDSWGPYNRVDMLERVKLLGYRSGFRNDAAIEMLLNIATYGGAAVMMDAKYGLEVGKQADFVVVSGETAVEAIIEQPQRSFVFKRGKLVAQDGLFIDHTPHKQEKGEE